MLSFGIGLQEFAAYCLMRFIPNRTLVGRPRAPLVALGLTVLAHALLLGGSTQRPGPQAAPAAIARPVLSVRLTVAEPAARANTSTNTPVSVAPANVSVQMNRPQMLAPKPAATTAAAPVAGIQTPASVFAATPAPSLQWHYLLRQNGQSGRATLRWQIDAGRYTAELSRELGTRPLPGWRSEGAIDAQGLAPQRYAIQRRGRDSQATNFRRDEGLISFSADAAKQPLPDGVQDRLSWWLQLGAIIAADPARFASGSRVALPVVGLRGQVQQWQFLVGEIAPLQLASGRQVPALHLRRETQGAHGQNDAQIDDQVEGAAELSVEIWLDPARHHLPLRLLQRWAGQERLELLLDDEAPDSP